MNERINELARQAGFEHPDHVGTCEIYAYFDHEKFAELIVLECADVAAKVGEEKLTGNDVGYVLKKHFGIDRARG